MNETEYMSLGQLAITNSTNYKEAVNYYEGLRAQLLEHHMNDRVWFEQTALNNFGDHEIVLPKSLFNELEDEYYTQLLSNRTPTLEAWLASKKPATSEVENND